MNGAQALIRTLVDAGVDTCFMNPGTSEMHFVAALDDVPEMHSVLGLFEGVATGAAEGYARIADKPAAVLLHLGPGLSNGLAHLHNANKGQIPVVNIVGDHATYHQKYDAPLQSDIETIARAVSTWIRSSDDPATVAQDAAEAVAAAQGPPGQVATLILPADTCWLESPGPVPAVTPTPRATVSESTVATISDVVKSGESVGLLLGGTALRVDPLTSANQICEGTGAKLLAETFPTRLERGAGRPQIERLGYLAEFAQMQLDGLKHLILVDVRSPVSFFAYPDKASDLVPEGCTVHTLAGPEDDAVGALAALARALGVDGNEIQLQEAARPELPTGDVTAESFAAVLGALMPEDTIVVDEGNTSGIFAAGMTAGAPAHDWLCLPGGAIGFGMPVATGAAIAAPDRPVINLESDGSSMYSLQSLWTQARENLNVTTIILNNSSYAILNLELSRVGASAGGEKAAEMLDLRRPTIDYVSIAQGFGVPAVKATTAEQFAEELQRALDEDGPHLIEIEIPSIF